MAEAKVTQQTLLVLAQGEPQLRVTQQALLVLYAEVESKPRRKAVWFNY